jgi:hypothetical protein
MSAPTRTPRRGMNGHFGNGFWHSSILCHLWWNGYCFHVSMTLGSHEDFPPLLNSFSQNLTPKNPAPTMKKLPRFTIGMGDRFAHQGEAQLSAVQSAADRGVPLHPVWNKSNREHTLIGTKPEGLRAEADAAVKALNWTAPYFVDADHINLHTVDGFLAASDFFTLDVADYSGKPASAESMAAFLDKRSGLVGSHRLPLLDAPLEITRADLERTAGKFLWAMQEAGRIYRHIAAAKPADSFAVEVSVDETDTPQTPGELLIILAMIADEGIPAQTIAPKLSLIHISEPTRLM